MTERLHGESERRRVEAAADALFGRGDVRALDSATLAESQPRFLIRSTTSARSWILVFLSSIVARDVACGIATRGARVPLVGRHFGQWSARTRGSSVDARRSATRRPGPLATRQRQWHASPMGRNAAFVPVGERGRSRGITSIDGLGAASYSAPPALDFNLERI